MLKYQIDNNSQIYPKDIIDNQEILASEGNYFMFIIGEVYYCYWYLDILYIIK
jgi:hypothetical protein